MIKKQITINYDNWRHNVRSECSYKRELHWKSGKQCHCYFCTARPARVIRPNSLDEQLVIMNGPIDDAGKVSHMNYCEYRCCPAIGRVELKDVS